MDNPRTLTAAQATDALYAVWQALDIPNAATAGEQVDRDRILIERARHVVIMLAAILGDEHPHPDPAWSVAYCRARLAEHPAAGYQTWDERAAELDAARGGAR